MEKVSMNKLEMARRAAKGGSGGTISPATSEKLGGVKIGEGVNVSEDGTISVPSYVPSAYSTEEVLTGRKWIDGKDIYEKVVLINLTTVDDISTTVATGYNFVETLIHSIFVAIKANNRGCEANCAYVNADGELKIHNLERWTELASAYVIIQYTKTTQE